MSYKIIWFDSLPSTNAFCKEQRDHLPDKFVLATKNQTSGKGSRGRDWENFSGKQIAFSIAHHSPKRAHLSVLPLVVGVAILKTLSELNISGLSLKWPNDLLINSKKIAGILCESSLMEGKDFLVCGIGLNLLQTKDEFLCSSLPYAGSVYSETGKILDPEEFLTPFLKEYELSYNKWMEDGLNPFYDTYRKNCNTLGKKLQILHKGQLKEGVALDISIDGQLLCEVDGEKQLFCARETSLHTE